MKNYRQIIAELSDLQAILSKRNLTLIMAPAQIEIVSNDDSKTVCWPDALRMMPIDERIFARGIISGYRH